MSKASSLRLNVLYACLLVLTGIIIYANSLQNPFIYDDKGLIVRNPSIHHLSDFKTIVNYNTRRWVGTWSFALNYSLGGLNVRGYHIVNILIHITCGLAVWWLFYLILSAPKFYTWPIIAEKETLSFWAALLFITHPVQTMAVDHITQRYASLAALFYLSSLCLYFKGRLSKGRAGYYFFLTSGLAGFMGLFTRETVVTLPLAIVLCEVFILGGFKKVSRKYCWLAGSLILVAGIILFFYRLNIVYSLTVAHYASQSHQGETVTSFNYFLTEFRVIPIYIRLLFCPLGLNFDYDMQVSHSFWEPGVVSGCLLIILLVTYALRVRSKYPLISFGILWFFLTLSVESTIFPIPYVISEYRLYLPLFGFCVVFVSVMRGLIQNRKAFTVLMGLIVFIFSILTIQRNCVYKDEVSLWEDTVKKSPYKSKPYINLGAAYCRQGNYLKGLEYLQRAVALEPQNYTALANLAEVYTQLGNVDKAIAIDERLVSMNTPASLAYNNLGVIYYTKGDFNKALRYFNKALDADNSYQEAYFNLAKVYLHEGKTEEAKKVYWQVLSQSPRDNMAKYALIQLYLVSKQILDAEAMAKDVLGSEGNDSEDLVNLGRAFASKGYLEMAMDFFSRAVHIDYTYPDSYLEMGKLLYNQHRLDDAVHVWQMGLKYTSHVEPFKGLIFQAQKQS